jgi:hypothetical protein
MAVCQAKTKSLPVTGVPSFQRAARLYEKRTVNGRARTIRG